MEVFEQLLQLLFNLAVRRPIGEGSRPEHRVVGSLHLAGAVWVTLLEDAFKPAQNIFVVMLLQNKSITQSG